MKRVEVRRARRSNFIAALIALTLTVGAGADSSRAVAQVKAAADGAPHGGAFEPAGPHGGFFEPAASSAVRPRLTAAQIEALVPVRGKFTFPPPYRTEAVRLTNASDCGGRDCVDYIGYSYWRRTNNHVGRDTMLVLVVLDRNRGGAGPTLFSYDKRTDAVTKLKPVFASNDPMSWASGDMWYFSAVDPQMLYVNDGPKLRRYDVVTKRFRNVFDVSTHPETFGRDRIVWQLHSSDDDRVHSATLRDRSSNADLGCLVYREDVGRFSYFPSKGINYDECQVDKSGQWLLIKEKVAKDPRFADRNVRPKHFTELYQVLDSLLKHRTTEEWLKAFDEADIPAMPVRTLEELLEDPHLKATGFFTDREHPTEGPITTFASPLDFEKTKVEFRHHAPRIGGDGEAILREAGMGDAAIEKLKADKTLIVPS